MAPHSSTLAWKIPWTEEPDRLQSYQDCTERLHFHFSLSCIGEGNGNPLQCSCLENPRDGGAWWAAAYGVTQSRIWLKRLSSSSSSSIHIYMCVCIYIYISLHSFARMVSEVQFILIFIICLFRLLSRFCFWFWFSAVWK